MVFLCSDCLNICPLKTFSCQFLCFCDVLVSIFFSTFLLFGITWYQGCLIMPQPWNSKSPDFLLMGNSVGDHVPGTGYTFCYLIFSVKRISKCICMYLCINTYYTCTSLIIKTTDSCLSWIYTVLRTNAMTSLEYFIIEQACIEWPRKY